MGQTSALYQGEDQRKPYVRMQQGAPWQDVLQRGGLMRNRRGNRYLRMTHGLNDLAGFNFVDGYSLGPHLTFGRLQTDRSRWEVEETVRWAFSREAMIARAALRWYSAVEDDIMIEAYGGCYTDDYDRCPSMDAAECELAASLFAWNHGKLLERRDAGLRLHAPLSNDLTLEAQAGWERRRRMENHRATNIFGAHPESNVPRLRNGNATEGLRLDDGPVEGEMARAALSLTYRPRSRHMVYDDLYCATLSDYPSLTFHTDMGAGSWRFAALDLSIEQTLQWKPVAAFTYHAGAGTMLRDGAVGLADWHHFDASRFWWQGHRQATRFALLDNYELSTDRWWCEAHAEFSSHCFLLNRLLPQPGLIAEYVQGHVAQVADRPVHWELQYGLDLLNVLRLGVALGGDGQAFRGAAFILTFEIFSI